MAEPRDGADDANSKDKAEGTEVKVGAEFTALARHVFDAEVRCYYGKEYRVPGRLVREMAQ